MTDVRPHDRGRAGRGRDASVEPGPDLDALLVSWGSAQDGPFSGGRHRPPPAPAAWSAEAADADGSGPYRSAEPPYRAPEPPYRTAEPPGFPAPGPPPYRAPEPPYRTAEPPGFPAPGPPPYGAPEPPYRTAEPPGFPAPGPPPSRALEPPYRAAGPPGFPAPEPRYRASEPQPYGGSGVDQPGSGGRRARPEHAAPPAWAAGIDRRPAAGAPNGPPRPAPPLALHPALLTGGAAGPAPAPPTLDDTGAYSAWLNPGVPTGVAVLDRPTASGHDLLTHDPYRGYVEDPDGWAPEEVRPTRPRHRAAGRRPRARWLRALGWLGAFLGVLAVAGGGFGFWQYRKLSGNIQRVDALAPGDAAIRDAAKQLDAENYLLIGSDTRAGANGKYEADAGQVDGERSDTTILAHLSPNREKAVLVSFPRDSWVTLPACKDRNGKQVAERAGQFNEAFATGGPACTVLAVQKLTGIKINHYVQVDFTGFKTMVDAVDGVPICTTTALRDTDSGLRLNPGTTNLRGEQALAYVRARYGIGDGSDLGRIQRQQRFLGAMMRKATSTKLMVNPVALTGFLDAATKSLTLDRTTSLGDLKALADQLRDLDPKRVSFLTAPIANPAYNPPGFPAPPPGRSGSKVLLDDIAGRKLWDSIINDRPAPPKGAAAPSAAPRANVLTVAPEDVTVRVLNGVGIDGLARKVAGELASSGFRTVEPTNGPRTTDTIVRYGPGQAAAAKTLGAAVPGAVLQPDAGTRLDLVVGDNYTGVVTVKPGDPATAKPAAAPRKTPAEPATPAVTAADARCA